MARKGREAGPKHPCLLALGVIDLYQPQPEGVGDGSLGQHARYGCDPRTPHLLFSEISKGVGRDEAPATPIRPLAVCTGSSVQNASRSRPVGSLARLMADAMRDGLEATDALDTRSGR